MQVAKWGNSLAVRLPQAVAAALELEEGDEIEIRATRATAREFLAARPLTREEAVEMLRRGARGLPANWKFDREEANRRGERARGRRRAG